MRDLEFLPDWYPQTRRRRRLVQLQAWLTLFLVAGMGAHMVLSDRNIRAAETSVATLQSQTKQIDAQLSEMDKLIAMQRQLRSQEQVVSRLGIYVKACNIMDTLDAVMPRQMTLTNIELENEEKVDNSAVQAAKGSGDAPVDRRLKVKVQGVCPTDPDLTTFMSQLGTVPFIESPVNLSYLKEHPDNGHVMREFEVCFTINLNGTGN
jgi:Tfp pilus assembly protein PilN